MAEINLKSQFLEMPSVDKPSAVKKAAEVYKTSAQDLKNKMETVANEDAVVQTSALYVITPDGVVHVRKTNDSGEVNYSPEITIQSYHKAPRE